MQEKILVSLRDVLLTRKPLEDLPDAVWERVGALNTWGSNAIEGNTLTLPEVQTVLLDKQSVNKPVSDVLETIQHQEAFKGLLDRRSQPITLMTVLGLHETVFKGVLNDAGQWRTYNVTIRGAKHTPPRAEKVVPRLEKWLKEYSKRDLVAESVFTLGAWMHYEFESIHPFGNGNGRVGRLLLNLHFLKHNWPPTHVSKTVKKPYYRHLADAGEGRYEGLVSFLETMMAQSLLDLLQQLGTKEDELKPLKEFDTYSPKYLSIRIRKGELPGVMVKGDWHTSQRALKLYQGVLGRNRAKRVS
jgi:Fic family protein